MLTFLLKQWIKLIFEKRWEIYITYIKISKFSLISACISLKFVGKKSTL